MSVLALIRSRITTAHPDHHAIAKGMAWVALFVFLGKLAGTAKEMAVAYRYGVGEEVDAYCSEPRQLAGGRNGSVC